MFDQEMTSFIRENYPDQDAAAVSELFEDEIDKAKTTFSSLQSIFENREQYSLHWAYKEAAAAFKRFSQTPVKEEISARIPEYNDHLNTMKEKVQDHIHKTSARYSFLSTFVSFIDIVISVALILVVTMISQLGEKSVKSFVLLILLIAAVALIKVSLDRFFIIPKVEKLGWRMYRDLNTRLLKKAAKITAMRAVILKAYRNDESAEDLVELCERGFAKITK
jgi:hypothetical protein